MLSESDKKKITLSLLDKISEIKCPMCSNEKFTILDGYVVDNLQNDYQNIIIGEGASIPSIMMICTNCGFMSQHALGILGVLLKEENK